MPQYLVQNNSSRIVRIPGACSLAIRSLSNPAQAWLSEDLYNSDYVQTILNNGVIRLVSTRGVVPVEVKEPQPELEPEVEKENELAGVPPEEDASEEEDIQESVDYSSWKLKDLKQLCADKGLSTKGLRNRKADYIQLLKDS